jgi:hypothetical protein
VWRCQALDKTSSSSFIRIPMRFAGRTATILQPGGRLLVVARREHRLLAPFKLPGALPHRVDDYGQPAPDAGARALSIWPARGPLEHRNDKARGGAKRLSFSG